MGRVLAKRDDVEEAVLKALPPHPEKKGIQSHLVPKVNQQSSNGP